jgi:hypothetical protein
MDFPAISVLRRLNRHDWALCVGLTPQEGPLPRIIGRGRSPGQAVKDALHKCGYPAEPDEPQAQPVSAPAATISPVGMRSPEPAEPQGSGDRTQPVALPPRRRGPSIRTPEKGDPSPGA